MGQEVYDNDPFSLYPELIRTLPSGQLPEDICTVTVRSLSQSASRRRPASSKYFAM